MSLILGNVLPDLAGELESLLASDGEPELAAQVHSLALVDRCRCDSDSCAPSIVSLNQKVLGALIIATFF